VEEYSPPEKKQFNFESKQLVKELLGVPCHPTLSGVSQSNIHSTAIETKHWRDPWLHGNNHQVLREGVKKTH
jgi:hypothetical protein